MVLCTSCIHSKTKLESGELTEGTISPLSVTRYCELNQPQFTLLTNVDCERYESSPLLVDFRGRPLQLAPAETEITFKADLSQVLAGSSNSLDSGIVRSEEAINILSDPSLLHPIPDTYRDAYEEKVSEVRGELEQVKEKNSELASLMKKIVRKVERLEKKREKEIKIPPEIEKGLPNEVRYIMQQVYGCLENNFCDACGPMMRKALTAAIDIRFKRDGKEAKMYDDNNRHLKLQKMIEVAKQERYITPSIFGKLSQLKWVGDISAHDYQIKLTKSDVEIDLRTLRMALERLYPAQKRPRK